MNADERIEKSTQQSAVSTQTKLTRLTTEGTEESGDPVIGGSGDLKAVGRAGDRDLSSALHQSQEGDKAIAMRWAGAMTALPGELAGKRRVTDAVCAMIVRTLLGADSDWQGQLSRYLGPGRSTQQSAVSTPSPQHAQHRRAPGAPTQPRYGSGGAGGSQHGQMLSRVNGHGAVALARVNGSITSGGILDGERPVMGPPFHWPALTSAPVNELGVVFLFGMLAGELGFQVESLWGRYPDVEARRQVQPGKWQRVRIEIEYESRNFALHRHDPDKCDVIVCWRHNWAKCPNIEVIELSRIIG